MRFDRASIRAHAVVPCLLATLLGPLASHAELNEAPAVGPDMNAYYHGADHERWRDIFESDGREVYDRRLAILAALELRPGMRVADVGAGTGLYTMLFADAVGPSGKVYAVDISESFVEAIEARASAAGLDNIVPVLSQETSAELVRCQPAIAVQVELRETRSGRGTPHRCALSGTIRHSSGTHGLELLFGHDSVAVEIKCREGHGTLRRRLLGAGRRRGEERGER
jgi:hypothetical protein